MLESQRVMAHLPSPRRVLVGPLPLLARPSVRVFLTSTTVLFVELLLIRWIPANVVYVSYFANFLLMGSFLGIGVGILLGRRGSDWPLSPFALLLLGVVVLVQTAQLNLQVSSPDDLYFGLADQSRSADVNFLVLPLVVGFTTVVLAALAMPLGRLLTSMAPLRAYGCDIAGSMTGIVLFTALSAAGTDPAIWFGVAGLLLLAMALGTGVTAWSAVSGAAMVATMVVGSAHGDIWSPYQRLTVFRTLDAIAINANGVPHQGFYLDPRRDPGPFYTQVDRWFPGHRYDDVLVIGAGTGNDTAVALARGARHVDAVDIDPAIIQIGVQLYPLQPYADPRVQRYVGDGRAFLRNAPSRYDLIVFALPDSLTLVSTTANVRLESFLFTQEAFDSARDHLAPDGILVLYNYYREPWLIQKIAGMLQRSFGASPIVDVYSGMRGSAAVLADGPVVAALHGAAPPGGETVKLDLRAPPQPATDDWPFLYLRQAAIAPFYLGALAIVLCLGAALVWATARASGTTLRRFSPHFFVLGVAFLLLETRSLVTFSLLFGNTWVVNSLVFFAILASVLGAVGIASRLRFASALPPYLALFGSLALEWALPPDSLLVDPPALRYALASGVAFAPVFFANLCFTYSFRDTRTADMAFASNLFGAMVGGAIEYVALLTGYQALLVVVALLYASAYVLANRVRVLADRELSAATVPEVAPA